MIKKTIIFKPLGDRVLVQSDAAEDTTKGGLIIPDSAKERPSKGTVLAVGDGINDKPLTIKVGDRVLYGKYSGVETVIEEETYLLMREADVFAIINPAQAE